MIKLRKLGMLGMLGMLGSKLTRSPPPANGFFISSSSSSSDCTRKQRQLGVSVASSHQKVETAYACSAEIVLLVVTKLLLEVACIEYRMSIASRSSQS
jgi:hypothetical protein